MRREQTCTLLTGQGLAESIKSLPAKSQIGLSQGGEEGGDIRLYHHPIIQ